MSRPTPLSGPDVHGPRALALWMSMAAAAGATNVVAFLACQRYVTHVTGIATNIGLDAADWEHALDYSLVLCSFILGAGCSTFVLKGCSARGGMTRAVLLVGAIIAAISAAGRLGFFDAFGEGLEDPTTFIFLGVLAFAMGLQNASIATATGNVVRTTHLTGPATDLGISLGRIFSRDEETRTDARKTARLRALTIVGFIGGAALGTLAAREDYLALLVPAGLCTLVGLALMRPVARYEEHHPHGHAADGGLGPDSKSLRSV